MLGWRWRLAILALAVLVAMGGTAVWTNALGAGDRFDRLLSRIETFIDPPPDRYTQPTVVVTPRPLATAAPTATPQPTGSQAPSAAATATPSPAPVRVAVNVDLVSDPGAVFASQVTDKWCAVAGTQMVLAVLELGDTSEAFQAEIAGRIHEWESLSDSLNGGWGPAAVARALEAYGEPGYEIRAYESYTDALRDSAIAIST
ncbi:MAG: hypothetical protein ACRDHD_04935, partial [Candidatus Limnocylindria bacterium]